MLFQLFNNNNCINIKNNNILNLNLLFKSENVKYLFLIKYSKNPFFIFSIFFSLKNSIMFNKSSFIPNLKFVKRFNKNNLFISESFDFFEFFNNKIDFNSIIFFNIKLNDFQIEFLNEFSLLNKKLIFIYSETIQLNKWKINLLNKISSNNIFISEINYKYFNNKNIYYFNNNNFFIENYKIILKI